ncbi:sigma-70 family RNA polymerase sigma factor [Sphaerisporangium sp. TRM90804]|uniref:RNA polymerase sigma factor n=1 Tax=Sphaerisporangium sp. TRM90804 TaxID=3031113 RepID=UPI0024467FAF|nr:sigma-70 family RNA polymerase sigma factor [Sphaerisporangium sp. TRM90804]MDH2426435.1 sigma-70 family RNA polymerase sigma factor [Sphaerisporangium sp. TRM90804]
MSPEDHEIETFIREHGVRLIAYLIGCGAPQDMAEAGAYEAFQVLHRLKERGRPPEHPAAFMRRVAVHSVRKAYKKQYGRELPDSEHLESSMGPIDSEDEQVILREDVRRLLRELPTRQRQVIERRYLRDYSVLETAGSLGISARAVQANTNAALKNLRRLVQQNPIWEEEAR